MATELASAVSLSGSGAKSWTRHHRGWKCLSTLTFTIILVAAVVDSSAHLVMTPHGLVPRERVIELDRHTTPVRISGHLYLVKVGTHEIVRHITKLSAEDVHPENKPYEFASKLRQRYYQKRGNPDTLADGTAHDNDNTRERAADTGSSNGLPAGSMILHNYCTTDWSVGSIRSFSTKWAVPDKAANPNTDTTFLWNGLSGGSLQPVMQWDELQYSGPQYSIANWCFNDGHYYHGKLLPVQPGDILEANITFLGPADVLNGTIGVNGTDGIIAAFGNVSQPIWPYLLTFTGYHEADITVYRPDGPAQGLILCWEAYAQNVTQWPTNLGTAMYDIHLEQIPVDNTTTTIPYLNWGSAAPGNYVNQSTATNYFSVLINNSTTNGEVDFYWYAQFGVISGAVYQIVSAVDNTSMLGTANGSCQTNTSIVLGGSATSDSQLWRLFNVGDGMTVFVPLMAPTTTMTSTGTITQNSAGPGDVQLQGYPNNTFTSVQQRWYIQPVQRSSSNNTFGYYTITIGVNNSYAIDTSSTTGSAVQVLPASPNKISQQFFLRQVVAPLSPSTCTPATPTPTTPTSTPASTSTLASTFTSTFTSTSTSIVATAAADSGNNWHDVQIIVGVVVGIGALVIASIVLLVYFLHKRKVSDQNGSKKDDMIPLH